MSDVEALRAEIKRQDELLLKYAKTNTLMHNFQIWLPVGWVVGTAFGIFIGGLIWCDLEINQTPGRLVQSLILILLICFFIVYLCLQSIKEIGTNPNYVYATLLGIALYAIPSFFNLNIFDLIKSSYSQLIDFLNWIELVLPPIIIFLLYQFLKKIVKKENALKRLITIMISPLLVFLSIDICDAFIGSSIEVLGDVTQVNIEDRISLVNISFVIGLSILMLVINAPSLMTDEVKDK